MHCDVVVTGSTKATYNNFGVRANDLLLWFGVIGTDSKGRLPDNPADPFRNHRQGSNVLSEVGLYYERFRNT
jgi:hypothetical protein